MKKSFICLNIQFVVSFISCFASQQNSQYEISEGKDISCVDFSRGEHRMWYDDKRSWSTVHLNPIRQWERLPSQDPNEPENYTRYTLIEVTSGASQFLIASKEEAGLFSGWRHNAMSVIHTNSGNFNQYSNIEEIKQILADRSKEVLSCRRRNDSGSGFNRMLESILDEKSGIPINNDEDNYEG